MKNKQKYANLLPTVIHKSYLENATQIIIMNSLKHGKASSVLPLALPKSNYIYSQKSVFSLFNHSFMCRVHQGNYFTVLCARMGIFIIFKF